MSILLRSLPGRSTLAWGLALVALLFCAPAAHAATFLFTFTTTQLLGALDAADGTHLQDGFFAIFLEVPTGYTAVQENSPDPTAADDWVASTQINNPFLAVNTTWVEFARDDSKSAVTLLTDANSGTGSMFLGQTYHDGGFPTQPISFGSTPATINDIMPSTAVFSFELTGPSTTSSSLTFTGKASAIDSSSPTILTGTKTSIPNNFTIPVSDIGVPEPATFIPLGFGAACMLAAGVLRKKKTGAGSRS